VVARRASTVSLPSPSLEEKEKVSVRQTMGPRGKRGKEASVKERVIAVLFLCNVNIFLHFMTANTTKFLCARVITAGLACVAAGPLIV